MKKRGLSDEEKRLWKHVAKSVNPLRAEEMPEEIDDVEPVPVIKKLPLPTPAVTLPKKQKADYSQLDRGAYAGVDGNTAARFKKGNYDIDATLDLHGYTSEKAHLAFRNFVRTQHAKDRRCLLVVTGKGKKDTPGLLRQLLPQWINEDSVRPLVLAFDHARQQHGGTGAYYILLKRKR